MIFIPRFLLVWTNNVLGYFCIMLTACGTSKGERMSEWRENLALKLVGLFGRSCCWFGGLLWFRKIRANIDYSKWLGPDWDKHMTEDDKFEKAGIYVSNHLSFCDILVLAYLTKRKPSFVAKMSVKRFPVVGPCAQVI